MRRGVAIVTVVFVTVLGAIGMRAAFAAQRGHSDPFAGTWKLNLAKSKYNVGKPARSEVRTYEVVPSDPSAKLRVSGPAESAVRTYEAVGDPSAGLRVPGSSKEKTSESAGEKLTVHCVAADGSPVEWGYTVKFDGKYYPITCGSFGSAPFLRQGKQDAQTTCGPGGADAIAVKRVSARRVEATLAKGGKATETASREVSEDGKTMTATARVVGATGPPLFVIVYDKQ